MESQDLTEEAKRESAFAASQKLARFSSPMVGRSISVFGVGKLGFFIAFVLVKCGVTRVGLYDKASVDPGDCLDTLFSYQHVGLRKFDAGKRILLEASPTVAVSGGDVDVNDIGKRDLERTFDQSDVSVIAVDDTRFPITANKVGYGRSIMVFPGFHRRASSGQVVITGRGLPCLRCAVGATQDEAEIPVLTGEPVLPIDIFTIAVLSAREIVRLVSGEEIKEAEANRVFFQLRDEEAGLAEEVAAVRPDNPRRCRICKR